MNKFLIFTLTLIFSITMLFIALVPDVYAGEVAPVSCYANIQNYIASYITGQDLSSIGYICVCHNKGGGTHYFTLIRFDFDNELAFYRYDDNGTNRITSNKSFTYYLATFVYTDNGGQVRDYVTGWQTGVFNSIVIDDMLNDNVPIYTDSSLSSEYYSINQASTIIQNCPEVIQDILENSSYHNDNYNYFCVLYDRNVSTNNKYSIFFIPKTESPRFRISISGNVPWVLCDTTFSAYHYDISYNTQTNIATINSQDYLSSISWTSVGTTLPLKDNFYNGTILIYSDSNFSKVRYIINPIQADLYMPAFYEPVLMIDDYNLRKSFKFSFKIPQIREDTKYFVFMKNFNRNSYNSVTADFEVISVTTPEGYDYSNYNNYLYYDNRDKHLHLPAGCLINIYTGTGDNNSTINLDLVKSEVLPHYNLGALTSLTYAENIFVEPYDYYSLIPVDYSISSSFVGNMICTILNNLDLQVGGSPASLRIGVLENFMQYLDSTMTIEEFRFQMFLNALYYGNNVAEDLTFDSKFEDFCFANSPIVSYENTKYDNAVDNTYYRFFRRTNVYNLDNQVNVNLYRLQYSDSQDVSSMLPSGTNTTYLSSPFYQDNTISSTGGNITYNINQVFYQYNEINYGVENSPLMREPSQDILSDSTTDNATLDNNTTEHIDNTSQDKWFSSIYKALLDIQELLNKIGKNIDNITTNTGYNISNNFNYLFLPNPLEYQDLLDNFSDLAEEHLGIVFQPFEFSYFILNEIAQLTDFNTISINIPAVYFHDVAIIPAYNFDFATILENQTFNTIHEFTLAGTDFLFIFMISSYAIEVFKEVFGSNDN